MAGNRKDSDDPIYARMRELARGGRVPLAAGDDEPPEAGSVRGTANRQAAGTASPSNAFGDRETPGMTSPPADAEDGSEELTDRSISSVLARLDARKAAMTGAGSADVSVSNRSLDTIVEEVLRPILADWLDRNLERVVRDQVDAALQAELAARERNGASNS